MSASEYFGKKLRELRKLNNLTAAQLASHVHCSPSLIYNIEKGLNRPQPELIVHVAQFFGVSTDYLLHDITADNEEELIDLYRKMDNRDKLYLFYLIKLISYSGEK